MKISEIIEGFRCEGYMMHGCVFATGEAEVHKYYERGEEVEYILFRCAVLDGPVEYDVCVSDTSMFDLAIANDDDAVEEKAKVHGIYSEMDKTEAMEKVKRLMDLYYEVM